MLQHDGVGVQAVLPRALRSPTIDPGRVRDPGKGFVAADGAPFLDPEVGSLYLDIGCTRVLDRIPGGFAALVARTDDDVELFRSEGLMDWQITTSS